MTRPSKRIIAFAGLGLLLCSSTVSAANRLEVGAEASSNIQGEYQITPNGQWVVYRGRKDGASVDGLYCVASVGGSSIQLNGSLVAGGEIESWQLSPDGARVVYLADQDTFGLTEVYVAPMPGGVAQKVNDSLVDQGSTRGAFAGTANNQVAYIAGKVTGPFTGTFFEVFSVPAGGGLSTRLNAPLVNGGDVLDLMVRPDGGRVLYLADQDVNDRIELYSVAPDGESLAKLNGPLALDGDVVIEGLAFSPDGNRVLYAADQGQDQRNELYSVPTLGGPAVRLNGTMVIGGDVTRGSQRFSPNGARVLYHADQNANDIFEIFSVPSAGGAATRLNGPLVTDGDVKSQGLQFSPDGARVLYTADQLEDETYELFTVPSSGGTATRLSGDMVEGGDIEDDAVFSPNGDRVLFRADRRTNDVVELFSTASAGGIPMLHSTALVTDGDVVRASFSPDGSQIIYLADQEVDEVFELFAVATDGGAVRKISGPMTGGGDVVDWKYSPDGSKLIYRADQDIDELLQLYAVNLNVQLEGDFNRNGVVDAADYTVWRNGLGGAHTAADYTTWKTNFGRHSGTGASALGSAGRIVATVPEPASTFSLFAAIAYVMCCHLNRASLAQTAARARTLPSRS